MYICNWLTGMHLQIIPEFRNRIIDFYVKPY